MEIKAFKREAVFIPIKKLEAKVVKRVKERLEFKFYDDKVCATCEWLPEKHNDICDTCPAYKGGYNLASVVKVGAKANKYLKVPVGTFDKTARYLKTHGVEINLVSKTVDHKIKPVNFTGTLQPLQVTAVDKMLEKKRGVLKSPPRTGKTVMGAALVCKLQKKTLIMASQRDWLMGFKETFVGSKTQKPLTDLEPVRIKVCKTLDDFRNTDVCLATVQTFYSEAGEKLLAKLRDTFSVILIDEVQTAAADKYVKIMARLNAEYLIGLSGTPQRKDMKEVLVDNVLGPILHEVTVDRVRPHVKLTKTAYTKTYKGQIMWQRMVSALENDPKRLKLIANQAVKDIKDGHLVLIPMAQVKPIAKLVKLINDLAGKTVCVPFTGKEKKEVRDSVIQKARNYRLKCLVGTAKILSVGINIPRASMLYESIISNNLPAAEQRFARVLTPMEDKPPACIRFFLDSFSIRRNCLRNEYFNCLVPKYKPIVDERTKLLLNSYFKEKNADVVKVDL